MDPDAALNNARQALKRIRSREQIVGDVDQDTIDRLNDDDAEIIIDSFEALDGWMGRGGFLPSGWESGR